MFFCIFDTEILLVRYLENYFSYSLEMVYWLREFCKRLKELRPLRFFGIFFFYWNLVSEILKKNI